MHVVFANLIEKNFPIEHGQREIEEKAKPLKLAPMKTPNPLINHTETEGKHISTINRC